MLIQCPVGKSKRKKTPKRVREQHNEWLKSIQSMSTNFSAKNSSKSKKSTSRIENSDLIVRANYIRQTDKYQSVDTGVGNALKPAPKVYTGTAMKGIATMHKSNAVPVFTDDEAKDISSMRR